MQLSTVTAARRALLLGALLPCLACSDVPRPERVVVVTIDTCRADHMSLYGYKRKTTPFLEELAERSVVFERAFSQASDTTPSHSSLFTSLYPFRHGAANGVPLDAQFTTLAEMLRERGMRTGAFVSSWMMLADDSGLDQGFEVYDQKLTQASTAIVDYPNERPAEETVTAALDWVDANREEPFFLFVHLFDPHGRYLPPSPYDTMFPVRNKGKRVLPLEKIPEYARLGDETDVAVYVANYDGEIRYVDDQLRRLFARFEEAGLLDGTLFVITADHGESLTEHEMIFSHGWRLFDPSIHVPLLISFPAGIPSNVRVDPVVQSVDVLPTVLDVLGLEPTEGIDGHSLLPLMEGRDEAERFALAKTTKTVTYDRLGLGGDQNDHYAIRTGDWKLMQTESGDSTLLFDLNRDPKELRDVAEREPAQRDQLGALLEAYVERGGPGIQRRELSDEERAALEERLRALGYVR